MEETRGRSQRQQNGAQKLRGLMLDALMLKKLSEAAKHQLENVIAKQLEEIVKNKFLELILSSEFKKQMEDVICNLLRVLTIRSVVDESSPPSPLPPTLLLHFQREEIPTLFADRKLGDQLGSPIEVALVDAFGKVVSEGAEASALLKLVLLDADAGERGEAMTWEEFKKAELMPRNNKRPLLSGKLDVKLQKGEGRVDPSVCFTDNSSWTRRKSFCLGLIPATSESPIVGAKTRAFTVKDHRSEGNKKCEIPKSSDKVWVLSGISKGGKYCRRLQERGIHSVGDFIAYLESNREELQSLFKPQDFKIIEAHVRMCKTNREDESMHGKHKNEDSSYNNGQALTTCVPNIDIDQSGELPKVPDEAQSKFHGQDVASNAEMYTATQQCVNQVQMVSNKTVSSEGLDFEDSNIVIAESQVERDANQESNNMFGQATPGQIGELHGNPLTKSIKRPWSQISKQDRPSNQAASLHKFHWTTSFSPSEMPDSNALEKDTLTIGNPKSSVCSELNNAKISISHVTVETIEFPSRSLGHWNESTLDPMTSNMVIEQNSLNGFYDEFCSIPMTGIAPWNLGSHIGMDINSNDLEDSSVWDALFPNKDGQ